MKTPKFAHLEQNNPGTKGDINTNKLSHTRLLTKIIIILKDQKRAMCYSEILDYVGHGNRLKDALHWLCCNKILIKTSYNYHGNLAYSINPDWEKIRDGE